MKWERVLLGALMTSSLIVSSGCHPAINRATGQRMAEARGWTGKEWECLDTLWGGRESAWRDNAGRPGGSYGIPQATPGTKMASHGSDWLTNPVVQIAWGLDYIAGRYGTPCRALSHSYAHGWY